MADKLKHYMSETITFSSEITVADLMNYLAAIPKHAKIHIDHYKGDQRDPSCTTITAKWDL